MTESFMQKAIIFVKLESSRIAYHGGYHLGAGFDEQEPPPKPIGDRDRHESPDHEHRTGHDVRVKCCSGTHAQALKDLGGVEEDGVHAGELLERRNGEGADD